MIAQRVKLVDAPVPMGAHLESALVSDTSVGYHWNVSAAEAVEYYQVEMAQFGWRLVSQFTGPEELLLFEKPYRSMAISVRPQRKSTMVSVLILMKYKD